MYRSCLLVNVGDNPDRPRPGRLWLRNLYHVHQRLCMAFPSVEEPGDHVHVERGRDAGFLYRVDPQPGSRAAILVQSAIEPDWAAAFRNAEFLLAAPPQISSYEPFFAAGSRFRFRLSVNPTRKIDTKSGPLGRRRNGKRIPVRDSALLGWLDSRAERAGFAVDHNGTEKQTGFVYFRKPDGNSQRLRSVRFDGHLEVADGALFTLAIAAGIGPAKAFGFGLLSVAPAS